MIAPTSLSPSAQPAAAAASAFSPRVWLVAVVLAGAFYLFEHRFDTSELESYALHLEQMTTMTQGESPLLRFVQVSVAFASVAGLGAWLFLTARSPRWQPISWLGLLMLMVILWCVASLCWSVDPKLTAQRLVVLLCCYVGAVGIGSALAPRELAGVAVIGSLTFLAVGILAELYYGSFRPWASEYRFAGTLHPNAQGINLGVLCCGAFCLTRRDEKRSTFIWMLLLVGLGFVILTKSRTSTGAMLVALAAVWLLQTSWRVRVSALGAGLGIAALALFAVLASGLDLEEEAQQAVLLGREEQSESLTGRLPVWFEVVDHIAQRPWLGHGYHTFWRPDNIELVSERVEWPVREAHNGYLDLTVSIGFIGCGLVLITALAGLACGIQACDASADNAFGFVVGMLLLGILTCFLESMVKPEYATFLTACALANLAHVRPERPR